MTVEPRIVDQNAARARLPEPGSVRKDNIGFLREDKAGNILGFFAVLACGIYCGGVVSYLVGIGVYQNFNSEILGQFGDFIGGSLNPLFAVMTLLGLLYTISLQREEIRIQMEELRIQNEVLQQTQEEMRESRMIAQAQYRHITEEAKKSELRLVLSTIDREVQERLVDVYGRTSVKVVFFDLADRLRQAKGRGERVTYSDIGIGSIMRIGELLEQMDAFLNEYNAIQSGDSIVSYYHTKYNYYADVLKKTGVIKHDVKFLLSKAPD